MKYGTFDAWMRAVDAACEDIAGVSIYDLSDQPFHASYEAGTKPTNVARRALETDGWPEEDMQEE